jgi:hypothetical protein
VDFGPRPIAALVGRPSLSDAARGGGPWSAKGRWARSRNGVHISDHRLAALIHMHIASLAFIEGAKPRDEIECALVIQMVCTHSATMAVLSRLGEGRGGDRGVAAMASAAARLLRAYATQVEALRRLRNGGSQTLRVEHVHVNEGGQALIGNVSSERSA